MKIKLNAEDFHANLSLINKMFLTTDESIYMKGFPTGATLGDIKERLEDKGQAQNIQMRNTLHKAFKGSIFAVSDFAKKFIETPRPEA
ncbi:hypothetical protein HPG69_002034 [Diceros bicornis minor]|uniref:Uncharacterized protein n=1 Tax=Diceros bicornis minor TaxID=77932 RepID=A0A7J7FCB0_DICBM|nr:hypothetical protein HPG69_002034 [Diceros bicornis minor]